MYPIVLAYVSAIQDISLSPVLISGAGTSIPGPAEKQQVELLITHSQKTITLPSYTSQHMEETFL